MFRIIYTFRYHVVGYKDFLLNPMTRIFGQEYPRQAPIGIPNLSDVIEAADIELTATASVVIQATIVLKRNKQDKIGLKIQKIEA